MRSHRSERSSSRRETSKFRYNQNLSKVLYDIKIVNPYPDKIKNKDVFNMCSQADVLCYNNLSEKNDGDIYSIKIRDNKGENTKTQKIIRNLLDLGC